MAMLNTKNSCSSLLQSHAQKPSAWSSAVRRARSSYEASTSGRSWSVPSAWITARKDLHLSSQQPCIQRFARQLAVSAATGSVSTTSAAEPVSRAGGNGVTASQQGAGHRVGVVIVDHGSRKKASNEMLVHFGLMYQQMTGAQVVEVAHMEIAEPTIEQAIGKCAAAGVSKVVIAPYFLSKGRHIQEDIPALVKEAQQKYPSVSCILADPIGIDPLMAQLIHNRVQAALESAGVPANL